MKGASNCVDVHSTSSEVHRFLSSQIVHRTHKGTRFQTADKQLDPPIRYPHNKLEPSPLIPTESQTSEKYNTISQKPHLSVSKGGPQPPQCIDTCNQHLCITPLNKVITYHK